MLSGRKSRSRRVKVPHSMHSRFSDYKRHRQQEESGNSTPSGAHRRSSSAREESPASTPASVPSTSSVDLPVGDDSSFADDESSTASSSAVGTSAKPRRLRVRSSSEEDEDEESVSSASSTMSRNALCLMAKKAVHVSERVPLSVLCGDDERVRRKLKAFPDGAPKEGYQYRALMQPVMEAAVQFYKESSLGLRQVAFHFQIGKDNLRRSVKEMAARPPGRTFVTTPKEEKITASVLMVFGAWGFAFDFDKLADFLERYLERRFLDEKKDFDALPDDVKCDVNEPHRPFKTNTGWISRPGPRWVANFIYRHPELTKRLAANRKLCHGKLGPELINR